MNRWDREPELDPRTYMYGTAATALPLLYYPYKQNQLASKFNRESFQASRSLENLQLTGRVAEKARSMGLKISASPLAALSFYRPESRLLNIYDEAAVAAHELGHAMNWIPGYGSRVGRLTHRLAEGGLLPNTAGKALMLAGAPALGAFAGIASGTPAGAALAGAAAAPAVASLFPIAREFSANRTGLQFLKNAGASEKFLKAAKRRLGSGWKSYALTPAVGAVSTLLAYRMGKHIKGGNDGND